jgi:Uma2 family endonuclease
LTVQAQAAITVNGKSVGNPRQSGFPLKDYPRWSDPAGGFLELVLSSSFNRRIADARGSRQPLHSTAKSAILAPMNTPLTHAAEGLDRRAFTVQDVIRMVEIGILARNERFELIGGEIVPMSPKGIRHERLKQWLMEKLVKSLPDAYQTIPETTFYLSDDTFIEPDFVIYPRESGLEKLSPQTCLLAIEIADSSLAYDLGRKARLYAEFGIGELWVIDVNDLSATCHANPKAGTYQPVRKLSCGSALTPRAVDGIAVNLGDYSAN